MDRAPFSLAALSGLKDADKSLIAMTKAPLPGDEDLRLSALQSYQILDTPPEIPYDDITFLASKICGTPMAAISLVDRDRQWFKSKIGLAVSETPRDVAFCAHAILDSTQPMVVEDARGDERFSDNPLVTGELGFRFYAGAPLVTSKGHALGTLCVIDQKPNTLDDDARRALEILSREVVSHLELRWALLELERTRVDQLALMDRFISHVCHELRSPLTAMFQYVEILLDGIAGTLAPVQREYLEIVHRSAKQLRAMIGDLVEVTRIKSDKLSIEREAIQIPGVLDEALEPLRLNARARGIEVSTAIDAHLPLCYADPARFKQVVTNLVENALKFTPEGGAIEVGVVTSQGTPGMIQVSVTDTGYGIGAEDRDHIFEQLFQIQDQRPEARTGLGLGLYICKDLVIRQGGRIWVDSELGRGTTFTFTLPTITLEEWIAIFLASRGSHGGPLALLSVKLDGSESPSDAGTEERAARKTWATLDERLPPQHLLLPRAIGESPQRSSYILAAVEPEQGRQLADDILEWLRPQAGRLSRVPHIEMILERISAQGASPSDSFHATASAVLRRIDRAA